jgi:hypothetical protein
MPLSLRRTDLSSPVYADKADYCVIEDGKVVGRIYEDLYTPADVRWFWSITAFHIDPALGPLQTGACRRWTTQRRDLSRVGVRCAKMPILLNNPAHWHLRAQEARLLARRAASQQKEQQQL